MYDAKDFYEIYLLYIKLIKKHGYKFDEKMWLQVLKTKSNLEKLLIDEGYLLSTLNS